MHLRLKHNNYRTKKQFLKKKKKKKKKKGSCDSKRHNTCMCRMKLIISVNISLMTFRQQINPKQTDN